MTEETLQNKHKYGEENKNEITPLSVGVQRDKLKQFSNDFIKTF